MQFNITLHWLKTPPHLLKIYVAIRVAELTGAYQWRRVRTEDNLADALSRDQLPRAFLRNQTWFTRPSWLIKDEIEWPDKNIRISEIPELKTNAFLTTTINDFEIFYRYSSFSKLCRVIAYCLRFRHNNQFTGPLCAKKINESEIRILKIMQTMQFSGEIKTLKNKGPLTKGKLINLSPFLDENDLIHVGGRLQKSQLTFSQKHPILLPSRDRLTDQIIREVHENNHHTGIQTTLCILRQRFWLLDGRNQVRKVIRACTRCFRFDGNTIDYKMGNLPSVRVCEATPFANTGGPFYIKEKKHRNRTRIKVYIYVCSYACQ